MAGIDNDVVYGGNIDFSGGSPVAPQMLLDGQLLIGSTALNAGGTHCNINTLAAGAGISITNGPGTITITNTAGGGGGSGTNSLAGNSGSATQVGGIINVIGSSNITTTGAGQTLTITPTGNLLAIAGLAGTGYVVQTGANTFTNRTFVAGSGISLTNADGVAGATTITASAIVPTTFTADAGSAIPAANNLNVLGTSAQGISTSGAGSTLTFTVANATSAQKGVAKFDSTNFTVTAGNVTSNALTVTAGTGLSTGGSVNLGGSVTLNLTVPVIVSNGGTGATTLTAHGVLLGEGTSPITATAVGSNGQVLIGATGADPAFATLAGTQGVTFTTGANTLSIGLSAVPNSALANSSITLNAGAGISITGSPVSLGGSATISATGTIVTQFSADTGVATPSGNNVNLLGTASQGISTSASGATVTFTIANATTAQIGVTSLATNAETIAGSVTNKAVTPDDLKAKLGTQTAHGVAIFEGTSSALGVAATSATSGVPLVSTGAGSDPAFGTAVVAGGGTGQTTLTNHSVLVGAGTSAITQLATGSTGQVLQSGGASADPTWSTATYPATSGASGNVLTSDGTNWVSSPPASAGGTSNSQVIYAEDLFKNALVSAVAVGTGAGFVTNTSNLNVSTNLESHPGIWELSTGTTSTGLAFLDALDTAGGTGIGIVHGGGPATYTYYFNIEALSTSSQRYGLILGLSDNGSSTAPTSNGIWIGYSDNINSGNWTFNTKAAGSTTTTNSSTAVATGWQVIQIVVNATATSVSFSAGTTLAGLASLGTPITTNIPTGKVAMTPTIGIVKSVGTTASILAVDLMTIVHTLTTAR